MESFAGSLSAPPPLEESISHLRDQPQMPHFRIPPLRDPAPSRPFKVPSPLEPSAGSLSDNVPKTHPPNANPPTVLPTLADFLNAARSDKVAQHATEEAPSSLEPPPKPIQPFINLRTVENRPYSFDDEAPRKRARLEVQNDGFGEHLHLPVPKVHKESSKPRPFGPLTILNGLNEPPPNAALFPPIETDSTPTILTRPSRDTTGQDGSSEEGRRQKIREIIELPAEEVDDDLRFRHTEGTKRMGNGSRLTGAEQPQVADENELRQPLPSRGIGSRKKLRKWTDQETLDLLRGVVRCGVGNWTAILSQPDLKFSSRTAANLKDRFRVCCPWAYESQGQEEGESLETRLADAVSRSESDLAGKIILPDPRKANPKTESNMMASGVSGTSSSEVLGVTESHYNSTADDVTNANTANKQAPISRGSQALSEKSQLTLASLGLQDPQSSVKSKRRLRRPFTSEEDDALLKGYSRHGFQWTVIQQDKDLNLMHRKATVLRDRFRTRFPDAYRDGGAATVMVEEDGKEVVLGREPPVPEGQRQAPQVPPSENNIKSSATKSPNMNFRNVGHRRGKSSQSSSNEVSGSGPAAPVDLAMLLSAPPSHLSDIPKPSANSIFPFSIDENGPGHPEATSDMAWADSSSPPPVWDDIG